jgi:hypothetical protein
MAELKWGGLSYYLPWESEKSVDSFHFQQIVFGNDDSGKTFKAINTRPKSFYCRQAQLTHRIGKPRPDMLFHDPKGPFGCCCSRCFPGEAKTHYMDTERCESQALTRQTCYQSVFHGEPKKDITQSAVSGYIIITL